MVKFCMTQCAQPNYGKWFIVILVMCLWAAVFITQLAFFGSNYFSRIQGDKNGSSGQYLARILMPLPIQCDFCTSLSIIIAGNFILFSAPLFIATSSVPSVLTHIFIPLQLILNAPFVIALLEFDFIPFIISTIVHMFTVQNFGGSISFP